MRERTEDTDGELGELIRLGTIAEVDLEAGTCVVETGDVQTGDIRWLAGRAGATRTWSAPTVGEQVLLLCPEGDIAGAIAVPGIFSDQFSPPGNSLRERMEFQDGAVIAYDPEVHALDVELPDGATVLIVSSGGITLEAPDGGLTLKGDVNIDGELNVTGDIVGDTEGQPISLKNHRHGQVQAGGAVSGKPVP